MIDRALGFGPVQQQSYYFQLIPIFLSIVGKESEMPAQGTTYRFSVSKGTQKFDENKFPIQANFNLIDGVPFMSVATCKLNFYVPNFNKNRKQDFTLRLIQNERNQDFEVGEYSIDISQLVEAFKQEKKVRHELKTFFSEDYELDFQIYIEKTRITLERAIKECQAERSGKSPAKKRIETSEVKGPEKATEIIPERDQIATTDPKASPQKEQRPASPKQSAKAQSTSKKEDPRVVQLAEEKEKQQDDQLETGSVKTGKKVPLVQTKFKQLAKQDTPSEIKLKESQRLSRVEGHQAEGKSQGDSRGEKVAMWLFLLFGVAVMYFAMHPNRRI